MSRNDDWFSEFINQYRPWLVRGSSEQIGRGLDLLSGGQSGKNQWKWNTASLPFIGDFYKWQDANNYWSDYFASRGMSWADSLYPTMMRGAGAGAGAIARGTDTVLAKSKTLGRLYEGMSQDYGDWSPRNRR